ncbi:unnamed protein product [Acanthosepion pharaonis]|uniref:Uncharacterized protein n=1 Tax=Acanthosepion pharaonis TaxID=158019 RepID=A0A812C1I0_ACAPH|nr:unnamed protein product [Sepia pharaonis]
MEQRYSRSSRTPGCSPFVKKRVGVFEEDRRRQCWGSLFVLRMTVVWLGPLLLLKLARPAAAAEVGCAVVGATRVGQVKVRGGARGSTPGAKSAKLAGQLLLLRLAASCCQRRGSARLLSSLLFSLLFWYFSSFRLCTCTLHAVSIRLRSLLYLLSHIFFHFFFFCAFNIDVL